MLSKQSAAKAFEGTWVVRKFQAEHMGNITPLLGDTTIVEHTRKQVQMHMAAKGILNRFEKKIEEKELFGFIFSYDEICFSMMGDVPVTVEPFLQEPLSSMSTTMKSQLQQIL